MEHFQSILADIIKQTISPSTLPLAGEDLIREFRLSDHNNGDDQVDRFGFYFCLINWKNQAINCVGPDSLNARFNGPDLLNIYSPEIERMLK